MFKESATIKGNFLVLEILEADKPLVVYRLCNLETDKNGLPLSDKAMRNYYLVGQFLKHF